MNSLTFLAASLRPLFLCQAPACVGTLFLSASDFSKRAVTFHASNLPAEEAWDCAFEKLSQAVSSGNAIILRADWEVCRKTVSYTQFLQRVERTRRNYFRFGLVLDQSGELALSEMEINANALLYQAGDNPRGLLNRKNCDVYLNKRFQRSWPDFTPEHQIALLTLKGAFATGREVHLLSDQKLEQGRRQLSHLSPELFLDCAQRSSRYLVHQCNADGRFDYGRFACFDRPIPTYNTLRHISTIWSMLCAYQAFREDETRQAIVRATAYCVQHFLRQNKDCCYFEDVESGELKLGSNGCALIMLSLYTELIHKKKYLTLMRSLARGIVSMQEEDGSFVHVLSSRDLSVKERTRIVYYDGEAVFGLLRLYALTHEDWILTAAKKAFDHFIACDHWQHHDHWLSYAVNEITRVLPEEKYFLFGIQNVQGHLKFIKERETAYPTLLELMLATEAMLSRLETLPFGPRLITQLDLNAFDEAMHSRAQRLLNAHFWPEMAMFFKHPARIVDSFFIRHHAFRVRIDDVQHFLSAFIGYAQLLKKRESSLDISQTGPATVFFGGRVQLGRRMHWKTRNANPLADLLKKYPADFRFVHMGSVCASFGCESDEVSVFRARPEQINLLTEAKIDLVALANEQAMALGPDSLSEELSYLEMAGVRQTGAGRTHEKAKSPVYVRCADVTCAILAFDLTDVQGEVDLADEHGEDEEGPGIWSMTTLFLSERRAEFAALIAQARSRAQVVLLAPKWGEPDKAEVSALYRSVGHFFIELGCDAVLGCCGTLKGLENYRGRPIIYDAGKLLFDDLEADECMAGAFSLELTARGVSSVTFWPLLLEYGRTRTCTGEKAAEFLARFERLCGKLGTKPTRVEADRLSFVFDLPERNAPEKGVWIEPVQHRHVPELKSAKQWAVQKVPENARIEPCVLGPLKLVGLLIPKHWNAFTPCRIESWWQLDAPTDSDLVFQVRGKTVHTPYIKFGAGTSHSGCNFTFPTYRWQPGVIYKDICYMPEPDIFRLVDDEAVWSFSVRSRNGVFGPYHAEQRTEVFFYPEPFYRMDFPASVLEEPQSLCWDSEQIAQLCGSTWLGGSGGHFSVQSVISSLGYLDSVQKPALFVASDFAHSARHLRLDPRGGSWDSHNVLLRNWPKFAGAIVERHLPELPEEFPQLVVDDALRCLIELGIAARSRFQGKVIGITGSVGKTTCCEMLRHTLAKDARVGASYASHNNKIGVPSIFASIPADYDYAVLEIAIPAFDMLGGSVSSYLTPHVAWVTQIAEAHLDQWKTLNNVARLKSRIFDGMNFDGCAVLNLDMSMADFFVKKAQDYGLAIIGYGTTDKCGLRLLSVEDGKMFFRAGKKEYRLPLPLPGRHTAMNILGILAVLQALDLQIEDYFEQIATFTPVKGRGNVAHGSFGGKRITIIDESYNACPASMRAALASLGETKTSQDVLLLGDMLALGEKSQELHLELVEAIVEANPSRVLLCGGFMAKVWEKLQDRFAGRWFKDVDAVIQGIAEELTDGDRVLVKASHGTGLGKFVNALTGQKQV